jgi:murein L,D-transpeptidase YcbB/YkuD
METLGYLYLYLLAEQQASDTLQISGIPVNYTTAFLLASSVASSALLAHPHAVEANHYRHRYRECDRPTAYIPLSTQVSYPQLGSRGGQVSEIQRQLNNWGFPLEPNRRLSLDGVFGSETDRAVRQFQTYAGLSVDGIVGPQTRNALFTLRR